MLRTSITKIRVPDNHDDQYTANVYACLAMLSMLRVHCNISRVASALFTKRLTSERVCLIGDTQYTKYARVCI